MFFRHTLADEEKKAYIDAELCLMGKEATLGLRGAVTKFDELQSVHVAQAELTHSVVSCSTPAAA